MSLQHVIGCNTLLEVRFQIERYKLVFEKKPTSTGCISHCSPLFLSLDLSFYAFATMIFQLFSTSWATYFTERMVLGLSPCH